MRLPRGRCCSRPASRPPPMSSWRLRCAGWVLSSTSERCGLEFFRGLEEENPGSTEDSLYLATCVRRLVSLSEWSSSYISLARQWSARSWRRLAWSSSSPIFTIFRYSSNSAVVPATASKCLALRVAGVLSSPSSSISICLSYRARPAAICTAFLIWRPFHGPLFLPVDSEYSSY